MDSSDSLPTQNPDSRMLQRYLVRAAHLWKLTDQEACVLFSITKNDLERMRGGEFDDALSEGQIVRAGIIIALGNNLRLLFNGSRTYSWPKSPNMAEEFGGKSPVDIMVAGGQCPGTALKPECSKIPDNRF